MSRPQPWQKRRRPPVRALPRVLGITGSIGMGKSTACRMLRRLGVAVHDADASVHRLMAAGGRAVPLVEAAFPGVLVRQGEADGAAIDRSLLRQRVLQDPAALSRLEAILHPLVRQEKQRFLARQRRRRRPVVALDIPLLFETGGEKDCDLVVVVSAPALIQQQRVLARPGMTRDTLQAVLARQMADSEKRRRADVVVASGLGRAETFRTLKALVRRIKRGCGQRCQG